MPFRWRKSKSLGKFVRVNTTAKGVGVSVGPRTGGARFNVSPTGQKSVSASAPGTGLTWSKKLGGKGSSAVSAGEQRKRINAMWAEIPAETQAGTLDVFARDPDTVVAAFLEEDQDLDAEIVAGFLAAQLSGSDAVVPDGDVTREGVEQALVDAGLRLVTDDRAGFGVREPDEKGAIRVFWVNGATSERDAQVPVAAKALRDAGFKARQMRTGSQTPGVIVQPQQ